VAPKSLPLSITGLPVFGRCVSVCPPLFASGPIFGLSGDASVPNCSALPIKPLAAQPGFGQLPIRLYPCDVNAPETSGEALLLTSAAIRLLRTVAVPAALNTPLPPPEAVLFET